MVDLLIKIGCFANKEKYSFSVSSKYKEVNCVDPSPSVRNPCKNCGVMLPPGTCNVGKGSVWPTH
jgi:hypothetical protein